jgi:sec-independent protein translocase protein TatB
MFGIGSTELVIIVIVALIAVGPSKLPQLMRSVGKGLAELRSVGGDVKQTLEREVDRAEQETRRTKAKQDLNRKAEEEAASEQDASQQAETEPASAPAGDEEATEPAGPADPAMADEETGAQSKGRSA